MRWITEFLVALQFLTRLPAGRPAPVEDQRLARAMAYFPVIGMLLGSLAAGCYGALGYLLGKEVAGLLSLIFLILITGNLHGDGLMDTADGLFGGRSAEHILEIMKDSRVGSHGATAGFLSILTKLVLLEQLGAKEAMVALVLMVTLGRWALVYGAARYPYVRPGRGTGNFTAYVGGRELFWASLSALLLLAAVLGWKGALVAGGVWVGVTAAACFIRNKIGGMTGDTLGALNEVAEILALVLLRLLF
ncbi:MAG: adenosylcobinamide-GDP ribazoletransferase [Moorellaceae bacterium]